MGETGKVRSFDPIRVTLDGYTLRFDWSADHVQVSIGPPSGTGAIHYMRLPHETFSELRRALAPSPSEGGAA